MTTAAYDHLRLDNQLCFALYAATNAVTRAYRRSLGGLGLTYPQYLAMLVLWEQGDQTVDSLADALKLEASALTSLLKRLEFAGWIRRSSDPDDERLVHIALTAEGRQLRRPVADIQKNVACRTQLSDAEFVDLRSRLHTLTKSLSASGEAEIAD